MRFSFSFRNFLYENKWILILFLISTIFFIIQHRLDIAWDFSAYVMNAENIFYGGEIYEVYRAPIISLILGAFIWIGKFAEYFYIILAAVLFLFSNLKLSEILYKKYFHKFSTKSKTIQFWFYFFSLNIFVLYHGLYAGTELLGLAFFQLFLFALLSGKISGYFLGLAFLSRYNFIYFIPLIFFNKNLKKVLANIGTFLLVLLPWYVYNLIRWGNGFTSIVDSYYLNIFLRQSAEQSINITSFLEVVNWLLPLFALGLFVTIYLSYREKDKSHLKYGSLFILISAIVIFDFINTPFKISRYLFNLTLPISFFSTTGLLFLISKIRKKGSRKKAKKYLTYAAILILIISSLGLLIHFDKKFNDTIYKNISNEIKSSSLKNCHFKTSRWVPINYYYPSSSILESDLEKAIKNDHPVILFKTGPGNYEGHKTKNIEENYKIISKKPSYIIVASKNITKSECIKWKGYSSPTIQNTCTFISERTEKKIGIKDPVYKTCKFLNPSI